MEKSGIQTDSYIDRGKRADPELLESIGNKHFAKFGKFRQILGQELVHPFIGTGQAHGLIGFIIGIEKDVDFLFQLVFDSHIPLAYICLVIEQIFPVFSGVITFHLTGDQILLREIEIEAELRRLQTVIIQLESGSRKLGIGF